MPISSPLLSFIYSCAKHVTVKKKKFFFNDKKMLSLKTSRPSLVHASKEIIVALLEQPGICYYSEKILFIAENHMISKFIVQSTSCFLPTGSLFFYSTKRTTVTSLIINAENYHFTQSKTPADDCRCETCENSFL